MAKKLDQLIVIDLEATCWEGAPPAGQESEIIEVGLTLLDVASGERDQRRSIFVRPERSTVSPFCTQLTTITQDQVDSGSSFADVCAQLRREFASKDRTWASWGDYDRRQFERQCAATGVAYPFGNGHLNIKTLFALAEGLHHEVGMAEALAAFGLPHEGTHHRAGDDAWNIAAIMSTLLRRYRGVS